MNKILTIALKEGLLSGLAVCLSKHNIHRNGQRFVRKMSSVTHVIHIAFVINSATTSVIVNLAVRHEKVEDLANTWRSELSSKDRKQTATIGNEFGRLLGRGQMRWNVRSDEDLTVLAKNIFQAIEEKSFLYLERYSELKNIQKDLSSTNPKDWHSQTISGRALRLPIIYALLGDIPKAVKEFVIQYEYLKSNDELLADDYPLFVHKVCQSFGISNPLENFYGKV